MLQLVIELADDRRGVVGLQIQFRAALKRDLSRGQTLDAADGHIPAICHQALQNRGHVQSKFDRVQEGPVDRRLVGHGFVPDQVDQPTQGGVIGQDQVQSNDRGGQGIDHITEGFNRLSDLLGNGHQEVQHRRTQVQTNVVDRNVRHRHLGVTQTPVPLQNQIGHERWQAHRTELDAQVHVGRHTKVHHNSLARVGQHAVQRQAVGLVAIQIQPQVPGQPAALDPRHRINVLVFDTGFKEQQFAPAFKRCDEVRIGRITVEECTDVKAQFWVVLLGVGAQEKA